MSTTLALRSPAPLRLPPLIIGCLAATWLIWGSTYLAIKWALVSLPPFFQMGSRFVAAGLLLGAFARWRGARWPNRDEWFSAAVLGALMLGGGYGATAVAQTSVSSGLLVALAQWPYGVRPSLLETAGITLGLVGVLLLTRGQGFAASPAGLLAIGLACVTWSLGTVWALHGLPGGHRLTLAPGAAGVASQMLAGGAMLLATSWLFGEQPVLPPDGRALVSWLYLVGAGSLVGFSAYMLLLQRTSAALASSYTFVNPIIGLVLGATLGGELISTLEWAAAAVVSTGVVLLLLGRREPVSQDR